jgi:molybdopterin molybdotransferase
MGGEDKGLLPVAGRPLVEHVVRALVPQVGAILINANRNLERYQALGLPVVPDRTGDFLGPLVGMASAMERAATPYLLSVPCDSPLVPADLAVRLYRALTEAGAELSVAHDGERMQPVFALLDCALLPSLLAYLEAGGRKIDTWYARHRVALADFSGQPQAFLNVNTPEDQAEVERRLARQRHGHVAGSGLDIGVPVLGMAAWSGTGKTTLLVRLLPLLRQRGLRVGLVKHAHHTFDVDTPGKDSFELRAAGASPVLVASRLRWAMMVETPAGTEPVLRDLLARFDASEVDLVLVEGFKHEAFPKLELYRAAVGRPPLYPEDPDVLAVATDGPLAVPCPVPVLDLNRPEQVAELVIGYVDRWRARRPGPTETAP